ncbi:hypothetical protein cypCar_00040961, partial [Cyprinus carpio]
DFDSLSDLTEESKVRYIAQRWEELGLKDVQVTNHTALLSYPGPALSTITDLSSNQCYLPSGVRCDQPFTSTTEPFAFAAYSAVGNLVLSLLAEVGFGGCLLYVDPCDAPFGNKTFGVTLNPGGNPFFREDASTG